MKTRQLLTLALPALLCTQVLGASLGTTMTYQGRLMLNGAPASGVYDLTFQVFTNNAGGVANNPPVTNLAVTVNNGLFTALVDFGGRPNNHLDFWLELGVRTNGSGTFTALAPRQPLTSTPFAWFADTASNALVATTALTATGLSAGVSSNYVQKIGDTMSGTLNVNASVIAGGAGVTTGMVGKNGAGGLSAPTSTGIYGVSYDVNGNGVMGEAENGNLAFALYGKSASGYAGYFDGNVQINGNLAISGTLGMPGLRIQQNTNGAPNFIGGASVNFVARGVYGAAIGGGGATNFSGHAVSNSITGNFGTVGGGSMNTASGYAATVGGGEFNIASGKYATAMGTYAFATGEGSTAMGNGTADGSYSTAMGGATAGGVFSTAMGSATASSDHSTAMGSASADGTNATAMGTASASGYCSTAMGGAIAQGSFSTAMGNNPWALGTASTAMGDHSTAGGNYSTAMGRDSFADGDYSTAMGRNTFAHGYISTAMGYGCYANGNYSFSIGQTNLVWDSANDSSIGGGYNNIIWAPASAIGGGWQNLIQDSANNSTIAGGAYNLVGVNAWNAAIPGGDKNKANGTNSFAAGHRAVAQKRGSFVWADSKDVDFDPYNQTGPQGVNDSFNIRSTGGCYIVTGVGADGTISSGTYINASSGGWQNLSDRSTKTNFTPVAPQEILDELAKMPIMKWNYNGQPEANCHLGPTAQDFNAAFGFGAGEGMAGKQFLSSMDVDGVALAAIQGLNEKLEQTRAENAEMKQQLAELRTLVQQLAQLRK